MKTLSQKSEYDSDALYLDSESNFINVMERTLQETAYDPSTLLKPFNQDDLYRKEADYSLYSDMLKDDQVSVLMQIKKDLILSGGFEIVSDEEDIYDDIVDDIYHSLSYECAESFQEQLEQILSAFEYGFSLSEKVFQKRKDGSISLKYIRTRHPASWLIHTDAHGIVEKITQYGTKQDNLSIDPRTLIHYINQPKFQNPYGQSDLRSAYTAWFIKTNILRYYSIYLEKAASPVPIAKYDTNVPADTVDRLFDVIKRFQAKTAMCVPKNVDVEFLEAGNHGTIYREAIDLLNMFIGRALFVPDLMGYSGSKTQGGAYALGESQISIFLKHINRRKEKLETIVNKEIIAPFITYNYGIIENPPYFQFREAKDETILDAAKLWIEAMKGRLYKPSDQEVNHFRSLIKFPEGEVEHGEDPNVSETPNGSMPPNVPRGTDKVGEPSVVKDDGFHDQDGPANENDPDQYKRYAQEQFLKRTDFKALKAFLDKNQTSIKTELSPIVDETIAALIETINSKKIIQNQKVDQLGNFKIKYISKMKPIFKQYLMDAYKEAALMAEREIKKTNFAFQPLPDEKYLALILTEIDEFLDDVDTTLDKKTRVLLSQAIRDGLPPSQVFNALSDDVKQDVFDQLDRFSRTKFTEVMNKGRLAYFEGTEVVQGYQYSAILDDRTTDICSGLDGKRFKAGEEPVPPLHFNCRSLLVPVTIYEEFKADKTVGRTPIDKFIEDNIGDGFSVK